MKKIQILPVLLIMLFVGMNVQAQDQQVPPFAIGLRANPDGVGITGKYFFIEPVNIELMVNGSGGTYYSNGPSATFVGLLEYNFIFPDPAWRIFLGGGAHVTSWKQYPESNNPRQTLLGLDAIAGIEYVFYEVPIGISLDIKPAINFIDGVTSFPNNTFGLGVRYYFGSWSKKGLEQPRDDGHVETGHGH